MRNMGAAVHDWHIQAWPLQSAKLISLNDFEAPKTFITNLKFEHAISSRKIIKFVTVKERQAEGHIKVTASKLIDKVKVAIIENNLQDNEI
jgi:hypothetical protein